ncbi:hypothetical protein TNCV_4589251 [Trichonephila clavipes]|nr:hypothetical protein TNCV_4589251 [Trichonephila clavipes]
MLAFARIAKWRSNNVRRWEENQPAEGLRRWKSSSETVILCQTDKLAGYVGGTKTTRNHIGMQGRNFLSCELRCKEEKKNRNSNTLMRQKTLYKTVVLQQVFESTTRSRLVGLSTTLHGIPDVLEDSSRHSCGRWL